MGLPDLLLGSWPAACVGPNEQLWGLWQWVLYLLDVMTMNDLTETATPLEMMIVKGNHPHVAWFQFFQVSEL